MNLVKELLFKVKKVELNGSGNVGIVLPIFYKDWSGNFKMQDNKILFQTLTGYKCELRVDHDFKSTRIRDPKVKDAVNEFILSAKEEYKQNLIALELNERYKDTLETIDIKKSIVNDKLSSIISIQGGLTQDEFKAAIGVNSTIPNYKNVYNVSQGLLKEIIFEKEIDYKWVEDGTFDFAYLNEYYEAEIVEDYEECEDYKNIVKKNFKPIGGNKGRDSRTTIDGCIVSECFRADGGGDKRSISVQHKISLVLEKPLALTIQNVEVVRQVLESFNK